MIGLKITGTCVCLAFIVLFGWIAGIHYAMHKWPMAIVWTLMTIAIGGIIVGIFT